MNREKAGRRRLLKGAVEDVSTLARFFNNIQTFSPIWSPINIFKTQTNVQVNEYPNFQIKLNLEFILY